MAIHKYTQTSFKEDAIFIHMDESNKIIKFASDLVHLIIDGSKIYTYRLGYKFSSAVPGDELLAADEYGHVFGVIRITERSVTTFGNLPLRIKGHEPYSSRKAQIVTFAKYYGRIPEPTEPVTILRFVMTHKRSIQR